MTSLRTHEMRSNVWCKGDRCRARSLYDNNIYKAVIKKIRRNENGVALALVKFDGYTSGDNEEIPVSQLEMLDTTNKTKYGIKTISNNEEKRNCLFQPLTGMEDNSRICEKYDNSDSDDDHLERSRIAFLEKMAVNTSQPMKKKKSFSKKDKQKISEMNTIHDDSMEAEMTGSSTRRKPSRKQPVLEMDIAIGTNECHISSDTERSDEDELEKPKFTFPAPAAKVPYYLDKTDDSVKVPPSLNQYLRDYQRVGIKFMYEHYKLNRGAILGDDMGLGKTVQVIGLLSAVMRKEGNRTDYMRLKPQFIRQLSDNKDLERRQNGPFLIIGPGSVLYNWLDELKTWGYFSSSKYHGADKTECLKSLKKGKYEIIVTTYETFRDNVKELNKVPWEAVIVDEVHRIKGLKAQSTQALRTIKTKRRFGLTGTALQNNMTELWSILDWAQPGCLGSLSSYHEEFVEPIEKGQRLGSTKRELAEARKKKDKFAVLRNQMMIRRTKKLIGEQLPKKEDNVVFCKLSELQISVYKAILNHPDVQLVAKMDEPCECGSGFNSRRCCGRENSKGESVKSLMFSYLQLLLKTSNHAALLIPNKTTSEMQIRRAKEVCDTAFVDFPQFLVQTKEASFRTLSDPQYCGKMKVLQGLLTVFYEKHSTVLLFSYSTRLLDIIEQYVMTTRYEYRRIDGSTSNKKRLEIVQEFNRDSSIFICLVSTKAGGLGLNMTGANVVIIFDPNWNPCHDLQAQDRAYRIGQRRNVRVFRLISAGTIEENVYLRQVYKQQLDNVAVGAENAKRLFHGIQGDRTNKGELFGVKNMFQLRTGDSCLTMDILQRNQKVETALKGFSIVDYIPPETSRSTDDSGEEDDVESDESSEENDDSFDPYKDILNSSRMKDMFEDDEDVQKPSTSGKVSSEFDSENVVQPSVNSKALTKLKDRSTIIKSSKTSVLNSKNRGGKKHLQVEEFNQTMAAVGDIFNESGVLHVHENPKIIGPSRAEDHMSKCAIQDVYELHKNSQDPAMNCDPCPESSESEDDIKIPVVKGRKKKQLKEDLSKTRMIGPYKVMVGQTPLAIRKQHIELMNDEKLGRNLVEFAQEILSSSEDAQQEILKKFYTKDKPELAELFAAATQPEKSDKSPVTPRKGSKSKKSVKKTPRGKATVTIPKGATFLDTPFSETQSVEYQKQIDFESDTSQEDLSSLEIGNPSLAVEAHTRRRIKSSTHKIKTSPASGFKRFTSRKASKQNTSSLDLFSNYSTALCTKEAGDSVEYPLNYQSSVDGTVEINELLHDMAAPKSTKVKSNLNVGANFSEIDDIFLEDSSVPKRRKPPEKTKVKKKCRLGDFGEQDGELPHDIKLKAVSATLKDDDLDCFDNPSNWKRRKRHKVVAMESSGSESEEMVARRGNKAPHSNSSISDNKIVIQSSCPFESESLFS